MGKCHSEGGILEAVEYVDLCLLVGFINHLHESIRSILGSELPRAACVCGSGTTCWCRVQPVRSPEGTMISTLPKANQQNEMV